MSDSAPLKPLLRMDRRRVRRIRQLFSKVSYSGLALKRRPGGPDEKKKKPESTVGIDEPAAGADFI